MKTKIYHIPTQHINRNDNIPKINESFGFNKDFIIDNIGKNLNEIIQLVSDKLIMHKDSDEFVIIHWLLFHTFKESKYDVLSKEMIIDFFHFNDDFYYKLIDFLQNNNIETNDYYYKNSKTTILCLIKKNIFLLSSMKIFFNNSNSNYFNTILLSFKNEFFFKDLGLKQINPFDKKYEDSGNYISSKKVFFENLDHFIDISNQFDDIYIGNDTFSNKNKLKESLYLMYALKSVIFKNLILKQDLSSLKVFNGDFKTFNQHHNFDYDDISIEFSRGILRHNMDYIGCMIPLYLLYGRDNVLVGATKINDEYSKRIFDNSFSFININKTIQFSESELNILNAENYTLINFDLSKNMNLYKTNLLNKCEQHNLYVCNKVFLKYARRHMEAMTNEELKNLFKNILNSKFNDGFFIKSLYSKDIIEIYMNSENDNFKGLTFLEKESKGFIVFSTKFNEISEEGEYEKEKKTICYMNSLLI